MNKPDHIEQNPHNLKTYLGNDQIKAHHADLGVEWEPWEEEEYYNCACDIMHFAKNYVKIINLDHGLVPYIPYPYQEKMYKTVNDNRFSITLAPRQSGKSIAFVIWLLHYALFNASKTLVIAANKQETAVEMLDRIKLALEHIPFFLQPGVRKLNEKSIIFSNKSKIYARATGKDTLRGLSANIVYLDEFAFVDKADEFYTSTYPVISSGKKTKIIVTSTANGVGNVFYTLWSRAIQKKNEFASFEVKWNDVPGRDEKWREETINNTSERQFMQEFENKFLGGTNTLINGQTLLMLQSTNPIFTTDFVNIYDKPKPNHDYVITADVSEGIGGDSSAFSIIDISHRPFKQVASYNNSEISPYMYAELLVRYAKMYNEAYLCIESNDHGVLVNNTVLNDLEYDNIYLESFQDINKIGLKTTKRTKRLGCTHFKEFLEGKKLIIEDDATIQEICKFEERGGTYQAASGCTDDLVMTLVLFGYLASTDRFKNEFDFKFKNTVYSEQTLEELKQSQIPPFGIIDNHIDADPLQSILHMSPTERYEKQTNFKKDDVFGVILEEYSPLKEGQNFIF